MAWNAQIKPSAACLCFLACVFSMLMAPTLASPSGLVHKTRSLLQAAPAPDFFFPLTNNSIYSSIPAAEYQAILSSGVDWISDPATGGTVIDCDRSRSSSLTIPGVTYGQNGPFTISFWAKPRLDEGQKMEYAYSHTSAEAAASGQGVATDPNVINIYYPQKDHPDAGVVRAIVRDNQDGVVPDPTYPTYLDSKGCVAGGACRPSGTTSAAAAVAAATVANGENWHQITLTTQPDGKKGIRMYIDGELVSEMDSLQDYRDASGGSHPATGGGPLILDGTLTLCARADLDVDRYYSGNLANLRIYNVPLDEIQVKSLYNGDAGAGFTANAALNSSSTSPKEQTVADPNATLSATVARIGGQPLCSSEPVSGVETVPQCSGTGYVCFPLSDAQVESALGGNAAQAGSGKLGVCTFAPEGVLLPNTTEVPAPMAFFPLNTPALESFPLREYKGVNEGATVASDQLFGGALHCSANDSDIVALDPVPYGATTGAFTVNVWVKLTSDLDSPAPMYLYSHRGKDAAQDQTGWGPNQVQLYFPQLDHPAHGVARLYVRDSNDVDMGNVSTGYIDSDGKIAVNGGVRDPPPFPLLDGNWHMISVTSQPQGGPGYRMYVDGQLAADLNGRTVPPVPQDDLTGSVISPTSTSSSELLHVDGGDPLKLDGNVILCSRGDDPAERHIDADIAYLSMWDVVLNDTQVAALYSAVNEQKTRFGPHSRPPGAETEAVSTKRPEIQRVSVTGRPCLFPTVYEGQIFVDCINSGDASRPTDEVCPVAENEWELCEPLASKATTPPNSTSDPQALSETPSMYYENAAAAAPVGEGDSIFGPSESMGSESQTARGPLYSADGRLCQFPLYYGDIQVNNCVSFGGSQFCWTQSTSLAEISLDISSGGGGGGEWATCATDSLIQPPEPGILGVDPSTVPVLQFPAMLRVTTDGEVCNFPIVVDGEIFDDCIELQGGSSGGGKSEPSCRTSSGQWKTCNLKNASPEYIPSSSSSSSTGESSTSTAGGTAKRPIYVAERTTVNGEKCIFPAAAGAYVWFDCAVVGGQIEGDVSYHADQRVCFTEDAAWQLCAPAANSTEFTTKALDISNVLKERKAVGQLGQLCSISSSSESSSTTPDKCDQGLSCVPMPRMVNSTAPENNPLYDAGFCATRPAGTTFVNALTLPEYDGRLLGNPDVSWVNDTMFDTVPVCNRSAMNAIELDNVPYGASGPFSVNLWMRRIPGASNREGDTFQYLFSHSSYSSTPGYSPNQVSIYVPEAQHPAYGTVRAIVKDSNDDPFDLGYIDSDGKIESSAPRTAGPEHGNINDGTWHMITLTTVPEGGSGYVLYVDGKQMANISQPTTLEGGSLAVPTGGDPALMSNDIFLCSRSDLGDTVDTARYYDGAIANVMLFDTALTAEQILGVFETYNPEKYNITGEDAAAAQTAYLSSSEKSADALEAKDAGQYSATDDSGSGRLSGGEIAGITFAVIGGTAALIAIGMLFVNGMRQRKRRAAHGGGGQGKFERFEENPFTAVAVGSPSYAERGYGGVGGIPPGGSSSSSKYPSVPSNFIPASSIQLSSSGQLGNSKPSSGVLTSEAVLEHPSAAGLHHVHVRTAGNSNGSINGGSAKGVGGRSSNPFGVATAAAAAPPTAPSAASFGTQLTPTTPQSPSGTDLSGASGSTLTDDVGIDPGKRNLMGAGKKSSARVILPE